MCGCSSAMKDVDGVHPSGNGRIILMGKMFGVRFGEWIDASLARKDPTPVTKAIKKSK